MYTNLSELATNEVSSDLVIRECSPPQEAPSRAFYSGGADCDFKSRRTLVHLVAQARTNSVALPCPPWHRVHLVLGHPPLWGECIPPANRLGCALHRLHFSGTFPNSPRCLRL